MTSRYALLLLSSVIIAIASAAPASEDLEEPERITLSNEMVMTHCDRRKCVDFNFTNPKQVVSFATEIRINEDTTYDINPMLQNIDMLIFENSTFARFPFDLFTKFPLRELDMRNCSIEEMAWDNFVGADDLRVLLLSDNRLTELYSKVFSFALNLQFLFLDNNQIERLNDLCFDGLTQLRHLNLANNRIAVLPSESFKDLPNLADINLSNNRLFDLNADLFATNSLLKTILLNGNELYSISTDLFKPATSIELLDLSYNPFLEDLTLNVKARILLATNCNIKRVNIYGALTQADFSHNHIKQLYFTEPESLEVLTLRDNELEQIATLVKAKNLRTLDLSDNTHLKGLDDGEFLEMMSLERLNLSNTSLSSLPMRLIASNDRLVRLNVANNQLKEINPLNFKYLQNLQHFLIHNNNWNCFSLTHVMNMLIRAHGISYTIDETREDFPGEYIDGIACMYRIEGEESSDSDELAGRVFYRASAEVSSLPSFDPIVAAASSSAQYNDDAEESDRNEVASLRRDLKAIVQFYEQKFDKIFEVLEDITVRLQKFEKLNETLFQNVIISV